MMFARCKAFKTRCSFVVPLQYTYIVTMSRAKTTGGTATTGTPEGGRGGISGPAAAECMHSDFFLFFLIF